MSNKTTIIEKEPFEELEITVKYSHEKEELLEKKRWIRCQGSIHSYDKVRNITIMPFKKKF